MCGCARHLLTFIPYQRSPSANFLKFLTLKLSSFPAPNTQSTAIRTASTLAKMSTSPSAGMETCKSNSHRLCTAAAHSFLWPLALQACALERTPLAAATLAAYFNNSKLTSTYLTLAEDARLYLPRVNERLDHVQHTSRRGQLSLELCLEAFCQ